MSQIVERTKIAVHAFALNILNRFRKHSPTGRVLIVFQQVFGDSILLLPTLEAYIELYHRRRGMEVTLICLPSIKKFWEANATLPGELKVEVVDFKKMFNNYQYFKEVVNKYGDFADISIATGSSLSADLLSCALRTKKRYGMLNCYRVTWPPHLALFQRLAYTDAVIPPIGMMGIQKHRLLLNMLGLKEYKGRLSHLNSHNRIIENKYCVICPGASVAVKRWPIERFCEVADWIIETYDLDIHLCGGGDERSSSDRLKSMSKHPERVFNHVGETSFADWSAIVQHADLVIGNDSATLHIAAATGRCSVCITGIYDKFCFFPYLVDELLPGERLPFTVITDKPCAYCRTKHYYAGAGNEECKTAIKAGKCALCISEITVKQVKEAIQKTI